MDRRKHRARVMQGVSSVVSRNTDLTSSSVATHRIASPERTG